MFKIIMVLSFFGVGGFLYKSAKEIQNDNRASARLLLLASAICFILLIQCHLALTIDKIMVLVGG